jgi:hypothetical protein
VVSTILKNSTGLRIGSIDEDDNAIVTKKLKNRTMKGREETARTPDNECTMS